MNKLLIAFTISVYAVPASVFLAFYLMFTQDWGDGSSGILIIPIIIMILVCALVFANIVRAIISAMRSEDLSFRRVLVFKLCLIPFYIVNFACWGFGLMVFHIALIVWPMIPFIIAYTYFTVVGTSAYNIANLINLLKDKRISTKQCIVHCILQLTFAVDVIDGIYLAKKRSFNIHTNEDQKNEQSDLVENIES